MNITKENFIYAPLKYVDEKLKEFTNGFPSERTELYYKVLKAIKKKQDNGDVPSEKAEELYKAFGSLFAGKETVECGYFGANIHYYLFKTCVEFENSDAYKEAVNKRILYLIDTAVEETLFEPWFITRFLNDYLTMFLSNFYGRPQFDYKEENLPYEIVRSKQINDLVSKNGTEIEKIIAEKVINIANDYQDSDVRKVALTRSTGKLV